MTDTAPSQAALDAQIEVPFDMLVRAARFLDEFFNAPNDADIEFRVGRSERGIPAVIVGINGKLHAFIVDEALKLASIAEGTLREYSDNPDTRALPNLIMGLRHTAQVASHGTKP